MIAPQYSQLWHDVRHLSSMAFAILGSWKISSHDLKLTFVVKIVLRFS